jgi:ABC-2 type transport system ATP-binding protein
MSKDIVIKVDNVSKAFKLPHEKQSSLKGMFVNVFKKTRSFERQSALKDISFEVKKGEFFGIVGRNGGGKSTLLKLIAGIYSPDIGIITVNGKLTPFIELGVGFNHELTGRENVYLNGALLGFSRNEMAVMYDDIVAFAELERFMDQKLKNYSSGMQVRLAFSIAIRAESEILVMDEVLAVGDAAFQKKCFDVFRELKNQGRTIILVTHDMSNVERFCDRVLVLNESKIMKIGTPQEAATIYSRLNINSDKKADKSGIKKTIVNRWGAGGIRVKNLGFYDSKDTETSIFEVGGSIKIKIDIERDAALKNTQVVCGLAIYNQDGVNVTGPNSIEAPLNKDATTIEVRIPDINFAPGEYKLTTAIYNAEVTEPYDFLDKYDKFSIISDHTVHGLVEVRSSWTSN